MADVRRREATATGVRFNGTLENFTPGSSGKGGDIYIYIYVAPSSRKEEEQVGEINLCKCV